MVLDATELGDLLPLAGVEYSTGAETIAETGEPHAQPIEPKPHCVQSFTYVFGLERMPQGERHVIERPARYEVFRSSQPYSLRIEVHGGEIYGEESGWLKYKVFETMPGTKGGLWTYRRLIDGAQFGTNFATDLSMFNWPGNDYREAGIIDRPARDVAAALQDAKRVSSGSCTGCRRRRGEGDRWELPNSSSGPTSWAPRIRQVSLHPRVEAHQGAAYRGRAGRVSPLPRRADCRHFDNSVGVGGIRSTSIALDRKTSTSCGMCPLIPLGALIPVRVSNLLAAAKNIGTTHNGCFRLHPVEWNIGQAAGALAAFCLQQGRLRLRSITMRTRRVFQQGLLAEGVPLAWTLDTRGRQEVCCAPVARNGNKRELG